MQRSRLVRLVLLSFVTVSLTISLVVCCGGVGEQDFPDDIPLPEDAEIVAERQDTLTYTTKQDLATVFSLYKWNLLSEGWELDPANEGIEGMR